VLVPVLELEADVLGVVTAGGLSVKVVSDIPALELKIDVTV
jgi:hypothetical protein